MINTDLRHVICKPVEGEDSYGVKVFKETDNNRMEDISYEIVEILYESSAHNGFWVREAGVIISKNEIEEFVNRLKEKGINSKVYKKERVI